MIRSARGSHNTIAPGVILSDAAFWRGGGNWVSRQRPEGFTNPSSTNQAISELAKFTPRLSPVAKNPMCIEALAQNDAGGRKIDRKTFCCIINQHQNGAAMAHYEIIWDEEPGGNVEHIAQHDLTPADV
jgi:hypothetical protein